MRALVVPVTPLMQNCSLLWCAKSGEGVVVDPGGDRERILAAVEEHGIRLRKILLTHAHVDHAGATAVLARELRLPIEGPHRGDQFWIESLVSQARMFGLSDVESFVPDRWLDQGDVVTFGEVVLEVRHCPGHTPGHVIFFCREEQLAVVGDVLFQGSIGRTDLPKGDFDTLIRSIRHELWPLGDEVAFIPGHGPMSTFGDERKMNPFVSDSAVHGVTSV